MKININIYEKIDSLFKIFYKSLETTDTNHNDLFSDDFFKMILKKYTIGDILKGTIYEKYKKKFGKYNGIVKSSKKSKVNINGNFTFTTQEKTNTNKNSSTQNADDQKTNSQNANAQNANDNNDNPQNVNAKNASTNEEYFDNSNYDIDKTEIKEKSYITKIKEKIFKKVALKCHPDRSNKYKDGILFTEAREHYDNSLIIGLIYLCNVLDIDTRFIKLESNLVNHLLEEIRILIEEIKIINEMKN